MICIVNNGHFYSDYEMYFAQTDLSPESVEWFFETLQSRSKSWHPLDQEVAYLVAVAPTFDWYQGEPMSFEDLVESCMRTHTSREGFLDDFLASCPYEEMKTALVPMFKSLKQHYS